MKRLIATLLILCLSLVCFGCGAEKTPSTQPEIRYDDSGAYYTQEGATYSMELQFKEPVPEGSIISLLLEEEEILTFTAETAFSHLRLSSPKLELNQPYSLKVNGVLQCHGKSRPATQPPQPGDIPEPTLSTVPQEPMTATTAPTQSSADKGSSTDTPAVEPSPTETQDPFAGSPFVTPPTVSIDTDIDNIPSLTDGEDPMPGIGDNLPRPTISNHGNSSEDLSLRPNLRTGGIYFTLTATVTGFSSVRDAS